MNRSNRVLVQVITCTLALLVLSACSGNPQPDAAGPRPGDAPYPVTYLPTQEHTDAVKSNWQSLIHSQGLTVTGLPRLEPITQTISSLPQDAQGNLRLPLVGNGPTMNEEETNESLRRFLVTVQPLVGAESQQLTLINSQSISGGSGSASYEQRLFRYPLRNGFGKVLITYTGDRRVTGISSTCLPSLESGQRIFGSLRAVTTPEQARAIVAGNTVTFTDKSGVKRNLTVPANGSVDVNQLVLFPTPSASAPDALDIHLAWEISVGGASQSFVYVDAVNSEILGTA
jgi:hypothetical protein